MEAIIFIFCLGRTTLFYMTASDQQSYMYEWLESETLNLLFLGSILIKVLANL